MRWRGVGSVLAACVALIILSPYRGAFAGQETRGGPPPKRQRDTVHLMGGLQPHDPKLHETLEGGAASLQEGNEVMILFDGKSVTWLRMHRNQGQRTPLEEAEIAAGQRHALAERLGVPPDRAPGNYFEYVQHLARAGAKVFVNRNAVRLYGLREEEIHPIARPISTRQMAEILEESDLCYTYDPR